MADPVGNMSGDELRRESAANLEAIVHLDIMRRRLTGRQEQIEARLLNDPDPNVRMKPGEGIPVGSGVMRVHEEQSGRAFVVKEEVEKRAGELGDLEPQRDHRVVVESMNDLKAVKPGLAAELLLLSGNPLDEDEEKPLVEIKEKVKYPTVAKLRAKFGEDTAMVGKPAKVRMVVLEQPGVGDVPIIVGREGMILTKKKEG